MAQCLEHGDLQKILGFFPVNLGTLCRCGVLGKDTSPSNASLDSGENDYLVGQRWQCARCEKMVAGMYALLT